jgi:chromosome segregation ATPase
MDTVFAVKKRLADLTTDLETSRQVILQLQRERHDLLQQVEDSKSEMLTTREALLEDRRRRNERHDEREALIVQLDAERKQLLRRLRAASAQLGVTEQGVETLTRRLRQAEEIRDAALCELGETNSALSEIRDQLRARLTEIDEPPSDVLDAEEEVSFAHLGDADSFSTVG